MVESSVFDAWYAPSGVQPSAELVRQRQSAAEAVGTAATSVQALDLVRVACAVEPRDAAFIELTRKNLQADRSEIVGDYELRLLCGCALGLKLWTPAPTPGVTTAAIALGIASFM